MKARLPNGSLAYFVLLIQLLKHTQKVEAGVVGVAIGNV